ncbi:transcriptional regulator NrdR, partial [Clostridium sporogenes]|nr:transcriptional regulator NrdR [Clostridium sporogenes]
YDVSYFRFSSLYRQFTAINSFMEELKNLMEKN